MKKTTIFLMMLIASLMSFAQNAPITFEPGEYGADWTWAVFENATNPALEIISNPDPSGINTSATVAKFTALQAGQPWAGVESAHGTTDLGPFVLDATNSTIKIMVWKTVISDVGIKLVSANGWAQVEIKVPNTLVNEWEELTFDFSAYLNPPEEEGQLDQVVVFPDFDLEGREQDNIVYFDNISFHPAGTPTDQPTTAAPIPPARDPGDVISLFSEAYTDVPVDTWRTDWSVANYEEVTIDGNPTKKYTNLDYVGIETVTNQIDITGMTHFHLDVWSPNATQFRVKLVDIGADAAFGGGNDTEHEIPFPDFTQGEWVSLDIPLSDFTNLAGRQNIAQLILSGQPTGALTVFVDNVYFYYDSGQTEGPNAPIDFEEGGYGADWTWTVFENGTNPALEIIANPDQSGENTSATVAKFTALQTGQPWAGVESAHGTTDLGPFILDETNSTIKIMVWKTVISDVGIKLIANSGWAQPEIKVANTLVNEWEELTFDFSGLPNPPEAEGQYDQIAIFPDFDLEGREQDNIVYFDNISFHPAGTPTDQPTTAAPIPPAREPDDVISIFSDAYTNVAGTNFNPGWGQTTQVSFVEIAGNETLKYANFNYQGTEFASPLDVTQMETLHIDMWTADATVVNFTLISPGPSEIVYSLPITPNQWVSYNIPLTEFGDVVDLADVIQFKFFDGDGSPTIFLDNIYFYKDGSGPTEGPNAPIDFEEGGYGADWTWTVFENDTNPALEIIDNPDQSGENTSATVAKFTALQTGQPWAGVESAHGETDLGPFVLDETNSTIKIMVWKSVISDVGIKLASSTGWSQGEIKVANTVVDEWEELTFDFSAFINPPAEEGVLDQIIVFPDFDLEGREQDNIVYFDNITFSAGGGVPDDEPTVAAPTPTIDEANVISLFSDAYTDVPVDTWRTDWSVAAYEEVTIEGNPTKKYSNLDYVGIETVNSQIDITGMTHFHLDVWSADFTTFRVKLVDFGADAGYGGGDDTEHEVPFTDLTQGEWVSLDISLADFTNLAGRQNIAQLILSGLPTGAFTVYVDNVFFYSTGTNVNELDPALNQVRVYPNPVRSGETVTLSTQVKQVEVFDISGRIIMSSDTSVINTAGMNRGVYFVRIHTIDGGLQTQKLIVK